MVLVSNVALESGRGAVQGNFEDRVTSTRLQLFSCAATRCFLGDGRGTKEGYAVEKKSSRETLSLSLSVLSLSPRLVSLVSSNSPAAGPATCSGDSLQSATSILVLVGGCCYSLQ